VSGLQFVSARSESSWDDEQRKKLLALT